MNKVIWKDIKLIGEGEPLYRHGSCVYPTFSSEGTLDKILIFGGVDIREPA